jgi:hypothetical protein
MLLLLLPWWLPAKAVPKLAPSQTAVADAATRLINFDDLDVVAICATSSFGDGRRPIGRLDCWSRQPSVEFTPTARIVPFNERRRLPRTGEAVAVAVFCQPMLGVENRRASLMRSAWRVTPIFP